jgi:hypothetical protein
LRLTPEDRAVVAANPIRNVGFVLEEWSGSLRRWRITNYSDGARIGEWAVDVHQANRPYVGVIEFWQIRLGEQTFDRKITFDWESLTEEIRLYAFGGPFGGETEPSGYREPAPEYTLFKLPFPPQPQDLIEGGPIHRFRVADPPLDSDVEPEGREFYMCKEEGKGFRWYLERCDLRPRLWAQVLKVHRTRWRRQVVGYTLRLRESGLKVWASPQAVKSDGAGQKMLHTGAFVRLVLNLEANPARRVERILPLSM